MKTSFLFTHLTSTMLLKMNRLLLLLSFGSSLLGGTAVVMAQPCGNVDEECDYDILIIGCGATGVGAAREIENFNQNGGFEPLLWGIFETDEVCGGRARAAYYVPGADQNPLTPDLDLYGIPYN